MWGLGPGPLGGAAAAPGPQRGGAEPEAGSPAASLVLSPLPSLPLPLPLLPLLPLSSAVGLRVGSFFFFCGLGGGESRRDSQKESLSEAEVCRRRGRQPEWISSSTTARLAKQPSGMCVGVTGTECLRLRRCPGPGLPGSLIELIAAFRSSSLGLDIGAGLQQWRQASPSSALPAPRAVCCAVGICGP